MTPNENPSLSEQIAERTCKFCNAAFHSAGMTLRHEAACAGRTPEQRAQATTNRDNYRNLYSTEAKRKETHDMADAAPESWTAHRGRKHRPKRMAPDTPVVNADAQRLRRLREADRERQRVYRAKHGRKRDGTSQLERAVKKASIMLTGQRVQITLSLDWETARRLLITMIPDITIDGVALK